jgi:hypothetical protein
LVTAAAWPEVSGTRQGCQIFLDSTYQNWGKNHKMTTKYVYQLAIKIPNGHKIYQLFRSKAFQNIPPVRFLAHFWSATISSGNPGHLIIGTTFLWHNYSLLGRGRVSPN